MALARQAGTNHSKQVVGSNDDYGKQRPRSATTTPGLCPERDGNQSEHEARRWKGQPPVKLHASLTPIGIVSAKKLAQGSLGIAHLSGLRWHETIHLNRPIALPKGRHGVAVRVFPGKLVRSP